MKHLISLLIFLLFSWLAIWWYHSCDWCLGSTDEGATTNIVHEKTDPESEALAKKAYEDSIANAKLLAGGLFAKDDSGQDIFRYPDNLQINNADGTVTVPSSLNSFSEKIAGYLGKNQDKELTIMGHETLQEQQSGVSLGKSRADYVKGILVKAGVNEDRIVTDASLQSYKYDTEGTFNGGIQLYFKTLDTARLAEVEKGIINKTLYSGFGQKSFKPDATLANYALELKNYLKKHPDKKVTIIGHTDDIGKESANRWYGKQRARNVRKYLISKGIPAKKLEATSKGESDPIVPNNSEKNRNKNRRIEIIVN